MAAATPLVDEFVEDLWYDEPAGGADPAPVSRTTPAVEHPDDPLTPDQAAPAHRRS